MEKKYKREKKTMDGNQAAAYVSYAYSDVAAIYPITPSSTMAEVVDEWAANGLENIYGNVMKISAMQSEAGAAGAVHGALTAGAVASTYTASQGLLLMIPNIYKIAGEQLPGVFHIAARTISTHALSIFGDHSDIYACRQTGAVIFMSSSVQQVMDLTPVSYMASILGKLPFLNCFDGFRTSHEVQKIDMWSYEQLEGLIDKEAVIEFKKNALNPEHGSMMGSAQNPDVFFQVREACNKVYADMPSVVEKCLDRINNELGTDYRLFNYYGDKDAENVIVAMGSVCQAAEETIDALYAAGEKNGLVEVHLYRPFDSRRLLEAIPETAKRVYVLDRTKEPGAIGEPLYLDVSAAFREAGRNDVEIYHGRYGLSSKNTTPAQIAAVYHNRDKKEFTIGINDDVTFLSLKNDAAYMNMKNKSEKNTKKVYECKFWGLGGDGTVSGNKNSIKIIGNHTNMYVQAYFDYDSKKSRGLTVSNLRFGDVPIKSTYLVDRADFVACHNETYLDKYDMVSEIKPGGSFLINCSYNEDELEKALPNRTKKYIAENGIKLYTINGIGIGKEIGLNNKISTILQAAFFAIANIIPIDEAVEYMKEAARNSYGAKGEKIVSMNYDAIDAGVQNIKSIKIPDSWKNYSLLETEEEILPARKELEEFVKKIQQPVARQQGNDIPVSRFLPYQTGYLPSGSSAHERRNVAVDVPVWKPQNCIQCNRCSYVCPHAVIRPAVLDNDEVKNAPKGMDMLPMTGLPQYSFAVVISHVDCTGCGSCVGVCPGKKGEKALEMVPAHSKMEKQINFDYASTLKPKGDVLDKFKPDSVKGSQFKKPLMEFCGACAGCGESTYSKLLTQLFGERMYIANATGCTSIWANSMPSTAYAVNSEGKGPAWSNSLFEDAAEFGFGMLLAAETIRDNLKEDVVKLSGCSDKEIKYACENWLESYDIGNKNYEDTEELVGVIRHKLRDNSFRGGVASEVTDLCGHIMQLKDYLAKKSHWIFGGDGWAYDIGYGGLDHVIASGKDINIFVYDTEVYSNTGGQASKATPRGAAAKFCAKGKLTEKKKLAQMAMTYGNVYVAQIAMGADFNQTVKAITEAEAYNGPSLIIAYSTCISHGIRAGLGSTQHEENKAVKSGYFRLFRYNPSLADEGEEPLIIDSKDPEMPVEEFYKGEIRFKNLKI